MHNGMNNLCVQIRDWENLIQELEALGCSDHSSSLTLMSRSLATLEFIIQKRLAVALLTLPWEEIKFSYLIANLPFMVVPETLISLTRVWRNFPIFQYSVMSGSDGWRVKVMCPRDNKCCLLCPHARDTGSNRTEREWMECYSTESSLTLFHDNVFLTASSNLTSTFTGLSSLPQLPTLHFKLLYIHINPQFFFFELSALNISTHA